MQKKNIIATWNEKEDDDDEEGIETYFNLIRVKWLRAEQAAKAEIMCKSSNYYWN